MFKVGIVLLTFSVVGITGCHQNKTSQSGSVPTERTLSDDSLLTRVQHQTFRYFWDGAEPMSGLARERIHIDGEYPQNDRDVVTIGGSGFGLMAIIAGIERGFITREQALERFDKALSFLEKVDRFHGAWSHWIHGPTGEVKPFSKNDNGGDLVETAFMAQALICVREYFQQGGEQEKQLAARADALWKTIEWDWYRQGDQNVLYWHWSPTAGWAANHPIRGYDECLITYVLAASSPTHGVPAEVYHEGWARGGAIKSDAERYGRSIELKHNVTEANGVGPLFWSHYSYLGLNPKGLKDKYADYWTLNTSHALIHYDYCVENPKGYKGYGPSAWGLTASYSVNGYSAHYPGNDLGVISPTAALSSIPYTPKQSLDMMRYLYEELGDKVWGEYGFYDAYSETENWFPQRYLAIDQGPIVVMIENHRSGLFWKLFMGAPEIKEGLKKLGFESPEI
ncbi:hypothetical protein SAMN05421747_10917 [Parapedobacter composti]|uniref:Glycoamylase-like domain-containing protein n=1 Tax=Parapedobacter composti TaxID=623281 RepID=A0A1I1IEC2_9SPHI|nr:glucoamylase family protein [Parapedobacter composti]SFC34495.1 hypothetical protein SAMN05421747_10917 [Parapedobacter composti]